MGAIIISLIVFFIFWIKDKKRWAWILGLCVLSHWFIDLIVHKPDLSIFFGSYKVGFGLWNYPYVVYGLEVAMFIGGWLLWKKKNIYSYILLAFVVGGFSAMVFAHEPEFLSGNDILRTFLVLMANILFIYLAYLSEKKPKIAE